MEKQVFKITKNLFIFSSRYFETVLIDIAEVLGLCHIFEDLSSTSWHLRCLYLQVLYFRLIAFLLLTFSVELWSSTLFRSQR